MFPVDFYVMNMGDACHDIPILLGRSFLQTVRTKIDVHEGTLTMEFDGEVIKFNIFDAMRFPADVTRMHLILLPNDPEIFMTYPMKINF